MPHADDRSPPEDIGPAPVSARPQSVHWPVVAIFCVGLSGIVAAASLAVAALAASRAALRDWEALEAAAAAAAVAAAAAPPWQPE